MSVSLSVPFFFHGGQTFLTHSKAWGEYSTKKQGNLSQRLETNFSLKVTHEPYDQQNYSCFPLEISKMKVVIA